MAPARIYLVPATMRPVHGGVVKTRVAPAPTPRPSVDPEALLCPREPPKTRKRERLNDLSAEQKMQRRKMKNREAAQTARDRKKERTQGLEEALRDLLEQNKQLKKENQLLLNRLERLESQQAELKREHEQVKKEECTLRSAASINEPQPRAQVIPSLLRLLSLISLINNSCPPSSRTSTTSTSTPSVAMSGIPSFPRREQLSLCMRLLRKRSRRMRSRIS